MPSLILSVSPDFVDESDIQRLEQVILLPFEAQVMLYEELIKKYHQRHPFFLFKMAQLYSLSGCATMALHLYQEVQRAMGNVVDPSLNSLIQTLSASAEEAAEHSLASANATHYYQRWKPTKEHKSPSSIPHPPSDYSVVLSKWPTLAPRASASFWKYLRELAIETNQVESTFLLTQESIKDLIRDGISEEAVKFHPESALHDASKTNSILNDTLAAYDQIEALVANPKLLTPEMVCEIHACLMKTARFCVPKGFIVTGHTRTFTRKSVLVAGASYSIECCKYPDVDTELDYICKMARQWIENWSRQHPFAIASWIHLVLVRCHPFEEGNGRLTRLLASIPLLKAGYPPISISIDQRRVYYDAINRAYDGNHEPLINCIFKGMQETLELVERL